MVMKLQSDDEETVKINSIIYNRSVADGPGLRSVLFMQGCNMHCKGCHNPQTWDTDGGYSITVDLLFEEIVKNAKTKRITISGGEPLLQIKSLKKLIVRLNEAEFNIALYTGYEKADVPKDILSLVDYIKTGKYIEERKTTIRPYVGSDNQVFEKVRCDVND